MTDSGLVDVGRHIRGQIQLLEGLLQLNVARTDVRKMRSSAEHAEGAEGDGKLDVETPIVITIGLLKKVTAAVMSAALIKRGRIKDIVTDRDLSLFVHSVGRQHKHSLDDGAACTVDLAEKNIHALWEKLLHVALVGLEIVP